jgi:hypothetical protein
LSYEYLSILPGKQLDVHAGQAVVQMARSVRNGVEYAIKFFVSRDAFNVEHALYVHGTGPAATGLAQFLPLVGSH